MDAQGQEVPQVERRETTLSHRSFSCVGMLTMHKQVKSDLPPEK